MTPLKPGDKVRIVIDATVTDVNNDTRWSNLEFAYDSGHPNPYEGFIYTRSDAVTVLPGGTEPIGFQQYATSFEEIGRIVDRYRNGNLTSAEALNAIHEQVGDAPAQDGDRS